MRVSPFTLLLIEDNDQDAELLTAVMQEVAPEVQVVRVQGATQAFEQLDSWKASLPPLLILLDLHLPDQHGHQVLERLKTQADFRHVPVVVLSSSDEQVDITRSYHLYANAYLTKPYDLGGYHDMVQTVVKYWQKVAHLPVLHRV